MIDEPAGPAPDGSAPVAHPAAISYDPRRDVETYTIGEIQRMSIKDQREFTRALTLYWQECARRDRDREFDLDTHEYREFGGHG